MTLTVTDKAQDLKDYFTIKLNVETLVSRGLCVMDEKNGLYDFIGSDIHDLRIYQQALSKIYLSKSEQERIRILMNNNQQLG